MAWPAVLNLKDDLVYIRLSSTLSFVLPRPFFSYLTQSKMIYLPIFSGYSRTTEIRSIIGPVSIYDLTLDSSAGVYEAEILDEEHTVYAEGVKLFASTIGGPAPQRASELCRFSPGKARLLVTEILRAPRALTYTAVNGRRYTVYWFRGAVSARFLSGYRFSSVRQAAVVPYSPEAVEGLRPGDVVEACWLYYKAGRGDFHDSGTSHQLNVYILPPT